MYMKPNNAGKKMCLWTQIANQNAKTQDAERMQAFFLCYTGHSHISTITLLIRGAPIPHPSTFPLRLQARDMQYLKTKAL